MKDEVATTLSALFNQATIELNNMNREEQIDFGERFFKPPGNSTPIPNSTSASPQLNSDDSSTSPIHPSVANLFSQFANRLNNNNNLTNLPTSPINANPLEQRSNYRLACSTPIKNSYALPIKNLCANVNNANNKDANLLATARNLSNYLSPTNNSTSGAGYRGAFNFPSTQPTSNPYYFNRERTNSFGNRSNYNHRTTNSKLMNSCFSPSDPSSPDDDTFGKNNWQDKRHLSILYNSFTGIYLDAIYRQARLHRQAAQYNVAQCTWRGVLPTRIHKNPVFSTKVFLGGIPWDITEQTLITHFSRFGTIQVVWPGKEVRGSNDHAPSKCGYVYIVFENQDRVKQLLRECAYDHKNGGKWFYRIPTRRMPCKEVQVIPWIMADSNYVRNPSQRLDPNKTIFAGALHGMITAEALARIMNDLFGNVVYVGIDTDKQKYPIGSARIVFSSTQSYIRAIMAGFVDIKSNKFNKKVNLDGFLFVCPVFLLFTTMINQIFIFPFRFNAIHI